MRFALSFILVVFLLGCGYKPSSTYTKKVVGNSVYVSVAVDPREPTNIPFIKDSMIEAVVSRFRARVAEKKLADTVMLLELKSVDFSPLTYDKDGYVRAYRTIVEIVINYSSKGEGENLFFARGEYDFNIEPNSVISDSNRQNAIKNASAQAIDSFFSYISSKGALKP